MLLRFALFLLLLFLFSLSRSSSFLTLLSCFLLLQLLQQDAGGLVGLAGLPLLGHSDDLKTLVSLLDDVLVVDGGNEPGELLVTGELCDVLHQPLHHLGVTLPEGGHQARHLPVVLTVDVGAGGVEKLDHVKVTTVGGQPQGGVALLVPHIHLGSPGQQQLHKAIVTLVSSNGQRSVTRAWHRGSVDIRSLVKEDTTHLSVASAGGLHERGEASLGPVLHIGLAVQQQRHHLVPALEAGQG